MTKVDHIRLSALVLIALVTTRVWGTDLTAGFSPGVSGPTAESVVLQAINGSKKSIHLAAYSFTSKPIAEALVAAHKRGVEVKALLDKSNKAKAGKQNYSGAQFLANMGIETRINSRYAIQHNKFMVIDGTSVETGSFNYTTAAAKRNAENALLITDAPDLAKNYEREWQRLWDESDPLANRY